MRVARAGRIERYMAGYVWRELMQKHDGRVPMDMVCHMHL